MKRALAVLDSLEGEPSFESAWHWEVLLLGLTRAAFVARYGARLQGVSWSFCRAAPWAPEAHERVCRWAVETVDTLGQSAWARRLGKAWWYLELIEKNASRGEWLEQLYRLALIQAATQAGPYAQTLWQLQHPELRAAVLGVPAPARRSTWRYLKNALAATFTHLVTWTLARPFRPRPLGQIPLTLYPLFWIRGTHERFFPAWDGPFLAWLMQPRQLLRDRGWRAMARAGRLIPLQSFSRLEDALSLWNPRWWARCVRFDLSSGEGMRWRFGGHDVSALVRAELARSLSSREFQQNLLLEKALARCRPEALVYRCEFQAFENAVLAATRGRVPVFGFRHCAMTPFFISHRFAPGELQQRRPTPDRFWVPGAGVKALLTAEGVASETVILCGPQRQPELVDPPAPLWQAGFTVLAALGIRAVENEAMLESLHEQLAEFSELQLLIRPHPVAPRLPASLAEHPRVRVVSPEEPGLPLLAGCQACVTPGSTMAFEAMALGTMPIVYEEPTTYSFYSLDGYHESMFVVRDASGLRQALAEVMAKGPEDQRRRAVWEATLAGALGDRQTPLAQQMKRAFADSLQ